MVNVDNTLLKDAHLWNRVSKMRLAIQSINPSPLFYVLSLLFINKEFVHIYLDVLSRETLYTKILRLPILYALQKCIIEMTLQQAKSTEVKKRNSFGLSYRFLIFQTNVFYVCN